jgi:hypothetical protein
MRLSVLAALGFTAFLGIMTINAPDANARVRSTTVVSGPRGTAVVTRSRGMRTATVVRRGRSTTVVRTARGAAVGCRSVIVNGVRVRRCR